jgi:hypothetical protein
MISLRVPELERAAWQKQANLAGLSLSEWIRKRCANGHASGVRSSDSPSVAESSTRAPSGATGESREPEAIPRTKGRCFHGKRIGERCWQCPDDLAT